MNQNRWYSKVSELLPKIGSEFSILDAEIDIDTHKQYLLSTKQVKDKLGRKPEIDVEHFASVLHAKESELSDKEMALAHLASTDQVEAFRTIEHFLGNAEGEIVPWTQLAFQESRVRLEASLTGQAPVFISSGLGGRNSLLRFFVVIFNRNGEELEAFQKKLLRTVLLEHFEKVSGEIEEVEFGENYNKLICLLPLQSDFEDIFRGGMDECNEYGNFLGDELIITNTKRLSEEEILESLEEKLAEEEAEERAQEDNTDEEDSDDSEPTA